MVVRAYWLFAFLGIMTLSSSFIWGFRYDAAASTDNYTFNILLYLAWTAVHLVMTRPWFKKIVYSNEDGSATDRRIYITITIVSWLAVLYFHKAVPGPEYVLPEYVKFFGLCAMMLSVFGFFEGMTFSAMGGFLGVPGYEMTHGHSDETPLMTEGSYAAVRHPMYRAAFFLGASSLIYHPNAGQLLWAAMIGLTFILFIPIEEKTLLKYRGEEYRAYMQKTPYKMFKGLW